MPRAQREALRNTPITEVKKLGKGHVLNPYEGACRKPITPPEAGGGGGGATRRDAAENPVVEGWGTNVKLKAQFCAREGCKNFQIPSHCKVVDEKEGGFTMVNVCKVVLKGCGRCKIVKYCSSECTCDVPTHDPQPTTHSACTPHRS